MDRNAYRDDNRTDHLGTPADQRETYPGHRETYPDQPEAYPGERETYPEQPDTEPDTYWRRRAVTLAAGLGVLGLLAWAFSGGGGAPTPHNTAASGAAAATTVPTSFPGTSPSTGDGANASASTTPTSGADAAVPGLSSQGTSGLPSATSSPARKSAKSAASAKAASATAAANTGVEPGGRCAPASVVLSLFGASHDYRAGQDPQFGVDAVSTASGTCTFDLSPARFHLVVMSAGRVIWDSADCAGSNGSRAGGTKLNRGVPVEESFTWNRAITLPGCVTLASSARPGSYTAQVRTPTVNSQVYTFRLAR